MATSAIDSAALEPETQTEDSASAEQADEAGSGEGDPNGVPWQDAVEEDTAAEQENTDSPDPADGDAIAEHHCENM